MTIVTHVAFGSLFAAGAQTSYGSGIACAIGALSHILIDCYTVSGVQALIPLTERTVVIFKKDWRIRTGSVQEIVLCAIFLSLIGGAQYSYTIGGPRKLINRLMKSPYIPVDEYARAGNVICRVKGKWRWADGRITTDVDWLVIGAEGKNLVFWDGEVLIRPKHGYFFGRAFSAPLTG